jgi:hypothetical protein
VESGWSEDEKRLNSDPILMLLSRIEIEKRVLELIKNQSLEMETRTGVETSLDEKEAREYIDEVIREIKK